MKKVSLIIPLLFVGCAINQPSISTQKSDASNAWDELDGKMINFNNSSSRAEVKSMLEVSNEVPNWFYSPPKSDKYFYGAGEGRDVESSKASALKVIAGEIQTAVSGTFSRSEGYSKSNGKMQDFYKSVRSSTRSEVKKIDFTNIEVVKTTKVDNNIYILVRIDKNRLFKTLKVKLTMLDNKIASQIEESKNYSLLDQLITINKVTSKIEKSFSLLNILTTLNPSFKIETYLNRYNSYLNLKTKILHKITFSIEGNDIFSQKLINIFNNSGYKIATNSDVKIFITKNIRNSETYGMKIARVTINIEVKANNKILNSASIECRGVSNTTEQAIAKASQNFYEKVQKIGINKLLGFE